MKSRDDILAVLQDLLVNVFEVEPEAITPQARLYEDLEIDSIDAVDLVIDPDEFKSVRTVEDVVGAVRALIAAP